VSTAGAGCPIRYGRAQGLECLRGLDHLRHGRIARGEGAEGEGVGIEARHRINYHIYRAASRPARRRKRRAGTSPYAIRLSALELLTIRVGAVDVSIAVVVDCVCASRISHWSLG
jgi:hypothetical protein